MIEIEKLVAKYREVIQFPAVTSARIIKKNEQILALDSNWSQRCLEKGKPTIFSQSHIINDVLKELNPIHTPPIDTSSELLSAYSPSGAKEAVLREHVSSEGSKKQHLEIWADNRLYQIVDLSLQDQHGEVYNSGEFSCLEWSSCEQKILYVAEKKQPKAEPFYPPKLKEAKDDKLEEKLAKKGEEYVFRQDWGDTLVGRHHPVLCVCELPTGTVSVPTGVPDSLSVGQALWVGDDIVGVGWLHTPRRLGLIFCTNRLSYVFRLTKKGTFSKLSEEGKAAHSPRLSPSGDYLVWLQRPGNGPHDAAHQLVKLKWGEKPVVKVDIVRTSTTCASGQRFYGLFCHVLPKRCFSDDRTLLLSTGQANLIKTYIVNTESGAMHEVGSTGSLSVLDVFGDLALLTSSTFDTPPALLLGHLSAGGTNLTIRHITQPDSIPPAVPHFRQHVFQLKAKITDTFNDFNAIYSGPTEGKVASVPLILWPHGGPHGMYFQCFSVINQFFISAGFSTLQVNYRGSTGMGQDSVDFLLGRVGDTDVKDCHQAALTALENFPCLDPKRVVLYGGSHGGFLVAHLSSQYPDFYKSVVAVNPVIDLTAMFTTSDIPDWAVVEAGFTYTGKEAVEKSAEFMKKLHEVSPIRLAHLVKAPTLLSIGSKDLRVPSSQGILYYHTLNSFNIPCKLNIYEDSHALSKVPVDIDATINAVLWFKQHLPSKD